VTHSFSLDLVSLAIGCAKSRLTSAQHAAVGGQVRVGDDVLGILLVWMPPIMGCFSQACSWQITFMACVRVWFEATPFILDLSWHLVCCIFQDVDGGIMTSILEEDWIDLGGSISHAQVRVEILEVS
jgi:hypothetical protein